MTAKILVCIAHGPLYSLNRRIHLFYYYRYANFGNWREFLGFRNRKFQRSLLIKVIMHTVSYEFTQQIKCNASPFIFPDMLFLFHIFTEDI